MSIQEPTLTKNDFLNNDPTLPMRMTEEQFVAWADEDVKAEWVDGEVIVMSPASSSHVFLNRWLLTVLQAFVEYHDSGEVLGSELMVRLPNRRRRIPDLLFVAKDRGAIVRENHIEGAPDLIIEIVSPDSESRDRREKYLDYQAAGVREYWLIDRITRNMELYVLSNAGEYQQIPGVEGKIHSTVLKGFYLRPEWVWQEKLPKLMETLKHLGVIA